MQNTTKGKIKILYVITKSNWGGAQRYVYDLATNLPKGRFDVTVVVGNSGFSSPPSNEWGLGEKLTEAGIRIIQIKKLGRDIGIINDIAAFLKLTKILMDEKPDVLHLNSSKAGGLGGLAGRITGVKKIIFTAHGWAFNEERGAFSKFLILFASWCTVALSHTTIAVSNYDRSQAERMIFLKNKIIRIHNGVRKIKFSAESTAREILLPHIIPLPNKIPWIGTIAELHNNKGLSYAIRAMKKLKERVGEEKFIYVIIGEGEKRNILEDLIQELHLEKEVFLVGKKENASTLLRAFNIFLLSSIKEGLPYVVLEAGMASLPVVGSAVGGVPEIIDDMKSGILVKTKHENEIAHALEFLLASPKKCGEFGEVLKERIVNDYSLEKMTHEVSKLYECG